MIKIHRDEELGKVPYRTMAGIDFTHCEKNGRETKCTNCSVKEQKKCEQENNR